MASLSWTSSCPASALGMEWRRLYLPSQMTGEASGLRRVSISDTTWLNSRIWHSWLWSPDPPSHKHRDVRYSPAVLHSFLHGQGQRVVLGERTSSFYPLLCSIPKKQSSPCCHSASICTLLPSWSRNMGWGVISMLMTPSLLMDSHPHFTPNFWLQYWRLWLVG